MPEHQGRVDEQTGAGRQGLALPPGDLLPERYLDQKLSIKRPGVTLLLSLVSGLALTVCFNVPGFGWLGFLALVPWVLAVVAAASTPWAMLASALLGLGFWMANVYWVIPITVAGYLGMCVYLSAYFLLAGWMLRHCYQRRHAPFFLILPVIWVGLELLRGHVITGFSWLLLGHSQYRWIRLIQIADLVGAYGLSFIVAMTNGLIVDFFVQPLFVRTAKGSKPSLLVAVGVISLIGLGVFSLVYGTRQMHSGQYRPGPKLTVIQENFPISVTREPAHDLQVFQAYRQRTLEAQKAGLADLIVWPESMAQPFLYPKVTELKGQADELPPFATVVDRQEHQKIFPQSQASLEDLRNAQYCQRDIGQLARQLGNFLLVGSSTRVFTTAADSEGLQVNQRNSAFLISPDGLILLQKYDKTHLVPFGEYIPFRKALPPLYKLILALSPYSFDHTIEQGLGPQIFSFTTRNGRASFRFATPICYEGTVPDLCRKFVLPDSAPKIDFLVNVSNDGWFNASWELQQHLICYVFRAVENRIPIARAVNTGISGFVDSTGRLHGLVSQDGKTRGVAGFSTAQLRIDSRISLYSRAGDWFALLCGLGSLVIFVDAMRQPVRHRKARILLGLMSLVMLADALGRWLL